MFHLIYLSQDGYPLPLPVLTSHGLFINQFKFLVSSDESVSFSLSMPLKFILVISECWAWLQLVLE